jgi:(p)ppGpp synthase/HD superfamily hydrolase
MGVCSAPHVNAAAAPVVHPSAVHDAVALRVVFKARRLAGEGDAAHATRAAALCYDAMAIVQRLYPTLDARYKDYIAAPKPNGYQSLHVCADALDCGL